MYKNFKNLELNTNFFKKSNKTGNDDLSQVLFKVNFKTSILVCPTNFKRLIVDTKSNTPTSKSFKTSQLMKFLKHRFYPYVV